MKLIFKISIFVLILIFPVLISCGDSEEDMPTSPIFSDVKSISIEWEDPDFTYYLPEEVEYAVLGIFSENIETSGDAITNEDEFLAGSMTDLDGWSRSRVSSTDVYTYDNATSNFTSNKYTLSTGTDYSWAVWGFDKYMNLTHASGCESITAP